MGKKSPNIRKINSVTLDLSNCQVTGDKDTYMLRPMELRLLKPPMTHPAKVLS